MASKAKTTVTFHSGILTIGGTVIEVAYKRCPYFLRFWFGVSPRAAITRRSITDLSGSSLGPAIAQCL